MPEEAVELLTSSFRRVRLFVCLLLLGALGFLLCKRFSLDVILRVISRVRAALLAALFRLVVGGCVCAILFALLLQSAVS